MRTLPITHIAPILRPYCAHIALTLRPRCAHVALTLRRSNFPRVRLCIPDRWSGLGLRRAFSAFSALKGRTSIQPGFVRKAQPWQRRGADIRMFSRDPQVLPGRTTKFLSISFVRQIRLPRKAGEANLPPELLATHLEPESLPFFFFGIRELVDFSNGWRRLLYVHDYAYAFLFVEFLTCRLALLSCTCLCTFNIFYAEHAAS